MASYTNCLGEATLTLLHSERPKLYTILAFLSAIGLKTAHDIFFQRNKTMMNNFVHMDLRY